MAIGLGISMLYGADPRHPPAGLWLRPVPRWFGVTSVAIVTRTGKPIAGQVEAFLKIVRRRMGLHR